MEHYADYLRDRSSRETTFGLQYRRTQSLYATIHKPIVATHAAPHPVVHAVRPTHPSPPDHPSPPTQPPGNPNPGPPDSPGPPTQPPGNPNPDPPNNPGPPTSPPLPE